MPVNPKYYRNDFSRMFLLKYRAGPSVVPSYQGLWKAGALTNNRGDVTLVRVPSPSSYGDFDVVGKILGQPGNPELPVMARYTSQISELLKMANDDCDHDLQIHMGSCKNPQDFNGGWDKIGVLEGAHITSYRTGELGALDPSERAVVNEEVPFAGESYYEIKPLVFASKASANVAREVIDITVCDSKSCGLCGLPSDGCKVIFAVSKSSDASPGLVSELIYSDDGGATWDDVDVTTLGVTEDPNAVACIGVNVIVLSQESVSLHHAAIADVLVGTPTWAEVATGFAVGGGPRAMFSASPSDTWIVGGGGYIYHTGDPTNGVDVQDAGVATVQQLNDVHGIDELNVVAVGNSNAVVRTTNGGSTWDSITGPAVGVNLNAVFMLDTLRWFVGTAGGRLFYTEDGGDTWREKAFPGSGAGVVRDIKFVTRTVGYMAHSTAAPAGRILRTIDGGNSWYVLPEGTANLPANDYINRLATCPDVNIVWGAGLADDATDGIIVLGA